MENKESKKKFTDKFLSDNLTGARDAYGFQYDVYATVKRDLTNLGYDKNSKNTKDLADVIKHIFFAFVSEDYEVETLSVEYMDYISKVYPDFDLDNPEALIYDALAMCVNTSKEELHKSLCEAKNGSVVFKGLTLNKIIYPMVTYYLNNIDSIMRSEDISYQRKAN